MAVILLSSCANQQIVDNRLRNYGNTLGNLNNAGFAVQNGNDLYFNYKDVIYKYDFISDTKEILNSSYGSCLNIVNDWIYYRGYDDDISGIYKMDINGQNKQKISDMSALVLIAINDKLYFAKGATSPEEPMGIYCMDIDGSNIVQLSDERALKLYIDNNAIYFSANLDNQGYVYKMNMDGTEKSLILTVRDNIRNFTVYKNHIYYFGANGRIGKISIDGGEATNVTNTQFFPDGFNICGNKIYCSNIDGVYAINLDTNEEKIIKPQMLFVCQYINVVNNKLLCYVNENDKNVYYLMDLDGSNIKSWSD